jgi:2-keto-4-pentenoate hydratase/2-oxohepta-3-ene-1,7-dioic acid hydratase in catechol pathway
MYFLTYELNGLQAIGLLTADKQDIIPLLTAEQHYFGEITLANIMLTLIQQGDAALGRISELASKVAVDKNFSLLIPVKSVRIMAPIPRPTKNIFCIAKNYVSPNIVIPKHPVIFTKAPTTVIGPDGSIHSHKQITSALDYEAELAVIIGKKATYVSKEDAMDYVFGYTIINDITARDLQKQHVQWFRGKSLDSSAPMGPYLVHKDAIPSVNNLTVSTKVNGEVRQNGNTRDFIFDIPTLISTISSGITLEPGDIIATGTPDRVGANMNPPKFLKTGDEVEVLITDIGTLKNTVV